MSRFRRAGSGRPFASLGGRHCGLLQVSCALLLERRESPDHFESKQNAPRKKQIIATGTTLTRWFAPVPPYRLRALWQEADGKRVARPLSWLDPLTRHDAFHVGMYRGYRESDGDYPVPALFVGAQALKYRGRPKPRARIPAQRPEDIPPARLAIDDLDHSDFMVIEEDRRDSTRNLADAQRFLAFLFSVRRSVFFASSLRERIYNIWLPPAVLVPSGPQEPGQNKIAVFPFIGLTRRPNSPAWRFVFTFSAIIVPTASEDGAIGRELTDAEVGTLVGCLDGPSTNPIVREPDLPRYRVVGDTWRRYANRLLEQGPACELATQANSPDGTLRNWLELLFFSVARSQLVGSKGRRRRYKSQDDKHLADEVLRSIRMTSCWSVLLDLPRSYKPANSRDASPRDGQSWSPNVNMSGAMKCFDHMAVGPSRWFRPTDDDRVDQGRVGERTWMAWSLPVRRCIVTFYFSRAEDFPARSRLNLFAVFGHMVAGLMITREILVKLGHDVELYRKPQPAAELRRKYVLELEEMFDLDIAWTFYRRIYQRLRRLRGLDDMYRNVRERTEMLAQHSAILDEITAEKRRTRLSVAAAFLAGAILGVTIWTSATKQVWEPAVFSAGTVLVAVIYGGLEQLKDRMKSLIRWLRRLRR